MGNSVSNITKNINETVTSVINDTLQKSALDISNNQAISVNCDGSSLFDQCVSEMLHFCRGDTQVCGSTNDLVKLLNTSCNDHDWTCSAGNITMKNMIDLNKASQQWSQSKTDISNNITSNLTQMAQAKLGGIQIGDKVTNKIKNVQKSISDIQNIAKQISRTAQTNKQVIDISGGGANVSGVFLGVTEDLVSNVLQKNSDYTSAVNDLATTISQSASLSTSSIVGIVIGIIVFIIIIIIIVVVAKKKKGGGKKGNGSDSGVTVNISQNKS
jgi:hypothetical protein